tara:strand:- start:2616 stop:2876 length:261 start_codon:yes stop_codon:yes gene_type:complete
VIEVFVGGLTAVAIVMVTGQIYEGGVWKHFVMWVRFNIRALGAMRETKHEKLTSDGVPYLTALAGCSNEKKQPLELTPPLVRELVK